MLQTLRNRAISGIISVIMMIPWIIFEFLKVAKKLNNSLLIYYYIILIVEAASFFYFIWGFKIIGSKTKNKLLSISAILTVVTSIIISVFTALGFDATSLTNIIISVVSFVISGAVTILFGIRLIQKIEPKAVGNILTIKFKVGLKKIDDKFIQKS